jgi:hypothetical protein
MNLSLFPVQVTKFTASNNEEIKEDVLPKILCWSAESGTESPSHWLTNKIKTSSEKPELNDELLSGNPSLDLAHYAAIGDFLGQIVSPVCVEIYERWINVYAQGDYQEFHTHLSFGKFFSLSFVHFLSFDSLNHSKLTFMDPLTQVRGGNVETSLRHYQGLFEPEVKEGDILVFPSYLMHAVKPSPCTSSTKPRVTIAGNVICSLQPK